jgi:hypothetical protein
MFPDADTAGYTRRGALKTLLSRFAYRHVVFDAKMAKSFYRLPEKDIAAAVAESVSEGVLAEYGSGYILREDLAALENASAPLPKSAYAMHRNDFLVKSNEHWLKERFTHTYPDTMYYLLIDGEFRGVAAGKFRYTPEIEDVTLQLPANEAAARKDEILQAVRCLCGADNKIKRFQGEELE